ncbi:MAG: hypothetical protein QXI12_10975, partial [Candidatus Methanomethyliaceae archaeon]
MAAVTRPQMESVLHARFAEAGVRGAALWAEAVAGARLAEALAAAAGLDSGGDVAYLAALGRDA